MDLKKILENYDLKKLGNCIHINNKEVNFMYLPRKDGTGYIGGLQCNFEAGTEEYVQIEAELVRIAKTVLWLIDNGFKLKLY